MKADSDFVDHVLELMSDFGDVNAKRMFGGYGLFREGLMFSLVADSALYLKADKGNEEEFQAQDLPKFTYERGDEAMHMSYYLCPEEAFQNSDSMTRWAVSAWEAAVRQDEAKPKSKRKRQQP